jgi:hypothetical protein
MELRLRIKIIQLRRGEDLLDVKVRDNRKSYITVWPEPCAAAEDLIGYVDFISAVDKA